MPTTLLSRVSACLTAVFCLAVFIQTPRAETTATKADFVASRPNIIVIVTDDQRYDSLGIAGNPIIQTPNLDRLAAEGLFFQNAYVTTSICMVSRASILTGQFESRHGINGFSQDLSADQVAQTYPSLLKAAGYKTGWSGKYGVGKQPPGDTFDFWALTGKGQPRYITKDENGQEIHDTDKVTSNAIGFLDAYGGGPDPFCLSLSFKAPHEQDGKPPTYFIQEPFQQYYDDVTIPIPVSAVAKYFDILPDFFHHKKNIGRVRWQYLYSTPGDYQENVKNYYRLVTGLDAAVGTLVAELKKRGLYENTAIIYLGDNGFSLGEHGLEGKWFGFEESIRIPLLISYPGLPDQIRQSRPGQIALNIDVAPTVLGLAGVAVSEKMQGKDLIKMASGAIPARQDFFYEHTYLGSPRLPKVEGVVTPSLKYMKYIEHDYEQLFDLAHDPHELENLADDPAHAEALQTMRARYEVLKAKVR